MARFTVNTALDVVETDDGLLSLREALAAANARAGPDRIVFSADLVENTIAYVSVTEGALRAAASQKLSIDGDVDGDGLADIVLNAGDHHHLTVSAGAEVTLSGLDLIGGQPERNGGGSDNGDQGARGENRGAAYGLDQAYQDMTSQEFNAFLEDSAGRDGDDGERGGRGEDGGDGADAPTQAAAIVNEGTLTLARVGFGLNFAFGPNGGDGGRSCQGGGGGQGGAGVKGDYYLTYEGEPLGDSRLGNGVWDGGDGGRGGHGGRGGDGGGDGGDVASAVLNERGATLLLQDVAFGGVLSSGYVFGANRADGGLGGLAGEGGRGGKAGSGGDGADGGARAAVADLNERANPPLQLLHSSVGDGGDGGASGDGGRGGDAGRYGDEGSAATVLNRGVVSGLAAFSGNEANAGDDRAVQPGGGGAGGAANGTGDRAGGGGFSFGGVGRYDDGDHEDWSNYHMTLAPEAGLGGTVPSGGRIGDEQATEAPVHAGVQGAGCCAFVGARRNAERRRERVGRDVDAAEDVAA